MKQLYIPNILLQYVPYKPLFQLLCILGNFSTFQLEVIIYRFWQHNGGASVNIAHNTDPHVDFLRLTLISTIFLISSFCHLSKSYSHFSSGSRSTFLLHTSLLATHSYSTFDFDETRSHIYIHMYMYKSLSHFSVIVSAYTLTTTTVVKTEARQLKNPFLYLYT